METVRKIRLGYISAGFCAGKEQDFLAPFLAGYDTQLFEVVVFSMGKEDELTALFRNGTLCWLDCSQWAADKIAARIQEERIDILVNLSVDMTPVFIQEVMQFQSASIQINVTDWCYTPIVKNLEYSVETPAARNGYVNVGNCCCHDETWQDMDICLGNEETGLQDIYWQAERGIPSVVYSVNPAVVKAMKKLRMEELVAESEADAKIRVEALAHDRERLQEYHRRLHWTACQTGQIQVKHYMLQQEQIWLKAFLEQEKCVDDGKRQVKRLDTFEREQAWGAYIQLAIRLYLKGKLSKERWLSLAWAYHFVGDVSRSCYWSGRAYQQQAPKQMTQIYLMVQAWSNVKGYVQALEWCRRAFERKKLGETILPDIYKSLIIRQDAAAWNLGDDKMREYCWLAVQQAGSWEEKCRWFSSWLIMLNCLEVSAREVYEDHLRYNQLFTEIQCYPHPPKTEKERKLRIGYITPDLRSHVMSNFCGVFLAEYDKKRFEVIVYHTGKTDQVTDRFRPLPDLWRDFSKLSYEAMAAKIYEDQVDILVDLAGHTNHSGLPALAWKPAPIQISGLGYMMTTGLKTVDYFLTDGYVDPDNLNDEYFSEKLIRLRSQFCYEPSGPLPGSTETPARKCGWVTFGVFNHYRKYTDEMIDAWRQILEAVPHARLLLKTTVFADKDTVKLAYERLSKIGVDMNRVMFEPATSDYMMRYLAVDIALDTYPYPGGGTTCDALYMGVPVVARYGNRHSTRFSYGILAEVGLGELASQSIAEYISKAVLLAGDLELLDGLHVKLRDMMQQSPLMDRKAYISDVENKYETIWEEYKAGV